MHIFSMKEPEIKLFGRKIQLPESTGEVSAGECSDGISDQDRVIQADEENQNPNETEESQNQDEPSPEESGENPKTPSIEEDNPKSEAEQSNSENQKTLKKPDKILPCPRCNSMDTKFCYYNNYNINQPRHFCRGCQRYWTAGGTMRNVPVGSGRRKNKNSTSHSQHITLNEALQASRIVNAAHNGFHHPQSFRPNGTVLSFGPDSQLCESMSSALNPPEKRAVNNGFSTGDQIGSVSGNDKDNCSIGSSSLTNGFTSHVPYVPWTFPWNSYPIPTFYPQPYWNCAWNAPWLPVPNQTTPPNSYPLGKRSRNGELLKPNSLECKENVESKILESSIVVPKTLRIDDPEEAAKSSIWETLGIKYDSAQREGLFKALQPKCDDKKSIFSNSSVLQANPAALSRSITFQEGV